MPVKMKQITLVVLIATLFASCGGDIQLCNLTVEQQDGSQPLATAQPRFSWQYQSEQSNVMQTTYRIVVASSRENA